MRIEAFVLVSKPSFEKTNMSLTNLQSFKGQIIPPVKILSAKFTKWCLLAFKNKTKPIKQNQYEASKAKRSKAKQSKAKQNKAVNNAKRHKLKHYNQNNKTDQSKQYKTKQIKTKSCQNKIAKTKDLSSASPTKGYSILD